jgi:hypothetical protein
MTALHAVVMLARADEVTPHPFERQPIELDVDMEILALESRQFHRDDVAVGRLVDVDWRNPTGGARRKPVPAMLDGDEIANLIPALERHESMLAQGP